MNNSKFIRTLQTNSGLITYKLIYKKVKNYNLRIKPDKTVELSVGSWASVEKSDQFIIDKQEYIVKHLNRFEHLPKTPEPTYMNGETINYLGKKLVIKIENSITKKAFIADDFLYLQTNNPDDFLLRKKIVDSWWMESRNIIYDELNIKVSQIFKNYGVEIAELKSRKMVSLWGSCMPIKKIITLNSALIEVRAELIEYVLIHEYVHFIHPNHSKNFYTVLASILPNWKVLKEELRHSGAYLLKK